MNDPSHPHHEHDPAPETPVDAGSQALAEASNDHAVVPDVDLLIRTGGEQRLSDFMLWECAYAELVFSRRLWPEFSTRDFDAALMEYGRRERRFGAIEVAAG